MFQRKGKDIFSRFTCPEKAVLLTSSFQAVIFLADLSRKKGFQSVKSPYFCVGQQKKKRTAQKKNW